MKKQVVAVAVASALTFAVGAFAQQQAKDKMHEMEAVLMVTKVDSATGVVHARTRKGDSIAVRPPADVNIGEIKEGSRYKVRFSEAVATAVEHGAEAGAAGATRDVERGAKGGEGTMTGKTSGLLEEKESGHIVIRTAQGETQSFKLAEGVSADKVSKGDGVTVTYQRAVASRLTSTPQPISDPAPAQ